MLEELDVLFSQSSKIGTRRINATLASAKNEKQKEKSTGVESHGDEG